MAAQAQLGQVANAQATYMKQHDLGAVFEQLATAAIYARPDNVQQFLADQVALMQKQGKEYNPAPSGQAVQTEEQAASYMTNHSVQLVLEDLFSRLLVARPADPLTFLHSEALAGKRPYFSDDDIRGMHSLHDPTGNNYISVDQARTALRNLGIHGSAAAEASWSGARVTSDEFVKVARSLLDSAH